VRATLRISDLRPGTAFLPFHYGYWDSSSAGPADGLPGSAANEATITDRDPASKQPQFKVAAARIGLAKEPAR
jgi:hypothetical protein